MSKNSSYDAVKRLVNILEHSGLRKSLELSDEDIADTLWLALQMGVENTQIREKLPQPPKEPITEDTKIQPAEPVEPPIDIYTPPPDSLSKEFQNEENIEGLPFQVPAAPALSNKLQISRALRPLMRKVPSYSRRILDVEATVNHIVDALIVEQEIWMPITKPQPERWLNLELVVEENRSSFIWQETINELTQILENYGIFHTVRTWNLSSDYQVNLQLVSRKKGKSKNHCQYNYRELYHSNERGLILLVSDCVSTIWQQKTIYQWLQKWSNQSPTAIMQLFPERLWLSSELGLGYKVKLSSFNPGVPNSKLICREDLDIEQALNLPIITLEPESLKEWAKVVAGHGRIQTPAIVLDLDFVQEQVNEKVISQSSEVSPEAIVDRFLATASPTAQRLAGLMAAVPVSLPVVHLIQKTMLPKSTPVNVAEVFLSGMIERKKNISSSVSLHKEEVKNREIYEYDFVPEVRKLLNQAMRLAETEKVLDVVSEYIAEKMGLSIKSFTALLLNLPDLSQEKQENLLPFAHVAAEVLRNLGGKYAEFAEEIETNKLPKLLDNNQPIFQLFAGEYICAVKWGGETGIWHEGTEHLIIYPEGEVQLRSRFGLAVIQNLTVQDKILSWSFDDNQTAASITFQVNSENSYFWEDNQTGKLFEGWLNYPNEGIIDFRGRFEETLNFPPFQVFEFEVANINLQPIDIRSKSKLALLIGVSEYQPGLAPKPNAVKNVEAMRRVLIDPFLGGFAEGDVTVLKNPQKQEIEEAIYNLFSNRHKDDLLLFYFSGHGIQDDTGQLYLSTPATKIQNGKLVKISAVAASFLHEVINDIRSQRQVLILDCCFSVAITQGMRLKSDPTVNVQEQLGSKGRAILTSSSSTQYSFEQEGSELSIYTRYLVEGIETGAADKDSDGWISIDELHEYASTKVQETAPAMTPKFYPVEEGHKILLAKSAKDEANQFELVVNRTQKTAQYYVEDLGNGITLEMVLIPEGSFVMGSPEDELERVESESPQHLVNIKQFCIGKYPVTQAQWKAVVALPQVNKKLDVNPSKSKEDQRPVESVSWYDAVEFCSRLARHTKRQYRLPSEAEWEYACRAGTTTPFHFGETITTDLANYRGTDDEEHKSGSYGRGPKGIYRVETTEVGGFGLANAFGLYDMHGNIQEWCLDDWHHNYEGAPTDGSAWFNNNLSEKQGDGVLRGGSWANRPSRCRSAYRRNFVRDIQYISNGFRVVFTAQ